MKRGATSPPFLLGTLDDLLDDARLSPGERIDIDAMRVVALGGDALSRADRKYLKAIWASLDTRPAAAPDRLASLLDAMPRPLSPPGRRR